MIRRLLQRLGEMCVKRRHLPLDERLKHASKWDGWKDTHKGVPLYFCSGIQSMPRLATYSNEALDLVGPCDSFPPFLIVCDHNEMEEVKKQLKHTYTQDQIVMKRNGIFCRTLKVGSLTPSGIRDCGYELQGYENHVEFVCLDLLHNIYIPAEGFIAGEKIEASRTARAYEILEKPLELMLPHRLGGLPAVHSHKLIVETKELEVIADRVLKKIGCKKIDK